MGRSIFLSLVLGLLLASADVVSSRQEPFNVASGSALSSSSTAPKSGLSGRILHVTDFHPDPHYKVGSAISSGCHSNKPKKDKERAGYWGSPVSGCDSPTQLVEASMAWIRDNWLPSPSRSHSEDGRSPFDFIIWTGDSARHDLDSKYPRTRQEIYDLNQWCLSLLQTNFPDTPIIPTIGNNDIFPHNIMWPGPNDVTSAYAEIWADVIPEFQLHTFQIGGYFSKEVIPGKLAVISMNTIYWYDSNKVVDGCKKAKRRREKRSRKKRKHGNRKRNSSFTEGEDGEDPSVDDDADSDADWTTMPPDTTSSEVHAYLKTNDPGTIQLEWLETQLDQYRKRGVHVHLIGHVPPTAGNYFDECYDVYTDIILHNQETIIGQHFGHMNLDAFFIQEDTEAVKREDRKKGKKKIRQDDESTSLISQGFADDLRKDYAILPGQGRTNMSYYHYFFEAPSIVPTYLPSIRVWTYNVTGLEKDSTTYNERDQFEYLAALSMNSSTAYSQIQLVANSANPTQFDALRRKHRRPKHRHRNKGRTPRHTDPASPVRSNQPLSLLGYSQWILNLAKANKDWKAKVDQESNSKARIDAYKPTPPRGHLNFTLEYSTYTDSGLWGDLLNDLPSSSHRAPPAVPRHLLERELSKHNIKHIGLHSSKKLPKKLRHLTEYSLPHITVEEMMKLARRLAVDDSLWKRFEKRVYQDSGSDE
ncbi:unnamed protein product [Sympodiomycopsis kandeliae]